MKKERWQEYESMYACLNKYTCLSIAFLNTHAHTHLTLFIAFFIHAHHTLFCLLLYYTHTPHFIWSVAFFNILYAHAHTHTKPPSVYCILIHTQSHSYTPYPFSRKQICPSWTLKQRNTNCILFQLCVHCAISFLKTHFSADMKNELFFCFHRQLSLKNWS